MRLVVLVQARYSSRRLPGKVLLPLAGKSLLAHVFDALAQCRAIDGVALATSTDSSDDCLDEFANRNSIPIHRGPLENVFARFLAAARAFRADAVVRISGDSPLIDPVLVDQGAKLFRDEPNVDIVSNVCPRSFPKGQSVEVLGTSALSAAEGAVATPEHREHVTPYFYANLHRYRLRNFAADAPRPELQLSVDTREDFDHCAAILDHLDMPAWQAGWKRCAEASDAVRRNDFSRQAACS